ncbi:Indole-3-glycerol phosphate synthase [Lachnospiraceae bacterium TWA4]|nr:Indole-3-glycerol phosphate synthase [Lachnospiraceae bacterium TWA4]
MPISTAYPFRANLATSGISFICEVKKASPSKGLISPNFPYIEIAKEYERAGASAISCLTEPKWFLGKDEYVTEISNVVSLPILRKDFTVDEYMIYEARALGASAILLICSLLDERTLKRWRKIAEDLGMDALVEAHDEDEVAMAIRSGAKIIGVNNRDLKTFTVDVNHSTKYRQMIPKGILFVSESGITTREDIKVLEENGTDAVLIGETLMRAEDKKGMLNKLRGTIYDNS